MAQSRLESHRERLGCVASRRWLEGPPSLFPCWLPLPNCPQTPSFQGQALASILSWPIFPLPVASLCQACALSRNHLAAGSLGLLQPFLEGSVGCPGRLGGWAGCTERETKLCRSSARASPPPRRPSWHHCSCAEAPSAWPHLNLVSLMNPTGHTLMTPWASVHHKGQQVTGVPRDFYWVATDSALGPSVSYQSGEHLPGDSLSDSLTTYLTQLAHKQRPFQGVCW